MTIEVTESPITLSTACLRTVGERLAFLRQRAGLTLTETASHTGLSKSELSRLENGTRRLKDHHVDVLARLYGLQPSALRDVALHQPSVAEQSNDRFLPCYDAASLTGKGIGKVKARLARLPVSLAVSAQAYMIVINSEMDLPVPSRSVVIIDPAARSVLGDLVANVADWSPPLMILRRNDRGELSNSRNGAVQNFPKAIAVFSASHFAIELTA